MKLLVLSLLLSVPTPPGFVLFLYLVSFFTIHALLKEIVYAYQ